MKEVTLEEALRTIESVLAEHRGPKADHIMLDKCLLKVRESLIKPEVIKD